MELLGVDIGNVAEVRRLVGLGADVNVESAVGWRPLHCAAANGHVEVARMLVQLGANVQQLIMDGCHCDRPRHTRQHSRVRQPQTPVCAA